MRENLMVFGFSLALTSLVIPANFIAQWLLLISGLVAVAASILPSFGLVPAAVFSAFFPFIIGSNIQLPSQNSLELTFVFLGIAEFQVPWFLFLGDPNVKKGVMVGLGSGLLFGLISAILGGAGLSLFLGPLAGIGAILLFIVWLIIGLNFGLFFGVMYGFLDIFIKRDLFKSVAYAAIFGGLIFGLLWLFIGAFSLIFLPIILGYGALFGFIWEKMAPVPAGVPFRTV